MFWPTSLSSPNVRVIIYIVLMAVFDLCIAQRGLFVDGSNASLRVSETSFLSVDGDFRNLNCDPVKQVRFNGTLYLSGSLHNDDSLKFTATTGSANAKKARLVLRSTATYSAGTNATLSGVAAPSLWELEMDKGMGSLVLNNDVRSLDTVQFKTGKIYMNGRKWRLIDPVGALSVMNHPYIKNEGFNSGFVAYSIADSGLVMYQTVYTSSIGMNPGNIGLRILGPVDMGSAFTVIRGFKPQVNAGKGGICRYFDVYSPAYSLANNTVVVKYTFSDFDYFSSGFHNFTAMKLFVSQNTDMNWSPLAAASQNTLVIPFVFWVEGAMSSALSSLNHPNTLVDPTAFRLTFSDSSCNNPPVSGLTADTLHICTGTVAILDAGNNTGVPNSSLKWEWSGAVSAYSQTLQVQPVNSYQTYKLLLKDVRGCVNEDSLVVAPPAPYPVIRYLNHLNACIGDSVLIKDTVTISSGSYSNSWVFSDASQISTNAQTFKHLFTQPGEHSMQLSSVSNYGCLSSAIATNVVVYPSPTASFVSSFDCNTKAYSFVNMSVSNHTSTAITASSWQFGAVGSSTLSSPVYSFANSGTYPITLRVTSSFGCIDSVIVSLMVYPDNHSAFTKSGSCWGDTVFFTNTSTCNSGPCSYTWDFGDGTTSQGIQPKHRYAATGIYNVRLKTGSATACPDSILLPVVVNPLPQAQFSSSQQDLCLNTPVYFNNTSTISTGSISSFYWNFGNTYTSSALHSSTQFSQSGIFVISLVAVSDSGCSALAVAPITVHPKPVANYTVTNGCQGNASQFISTSIGTGLNYQWFYGNAGISNPGTSGVHVYTYPQAGVYTSSLIVMDTWMCSDTAVASHTVYPSPLVNLGNQISTCGSSYTLDAGNTGSYYYWYPGNQTTQQVTAVNSGSYAVVVTNTNSCVGTGSVQVSLNAQVVPHLGNDTTVCGSLMLNAGYPGASFLWNNSASTQTLLAGSSGSYAVSVTDQNGCMGSDTILLNVLPPAIVNLGPDLNLCLPKYGYNLSPTTNASSFVWNTGSHSGQAIVHTSGTYWMEGTAANGCKTRDSINLQFLPTPQVNLGPDRSACGSLVLDAQNSQATCLWNNATNGSQITIFETGTYWVNATNTITGCSQQDSVELIIFPAVQIFLGNDTSVCDQDPFVLNAANPGATYAWWSGQTTATLEVQSSGLYGVVVTAAGGCTGSDYINVQLRSSPTIDLGNTTRYLCGSSSVSVTLDTGGEILWTDKQDTLSASNTLVTNKPGRYYVNVWKDGCRASDSLLVLATNQTIVAQFLASTIDTVNKPVQFVNLSEPTPSSQLWTFGDGTNSFEYSPAHTFVLPVDYSVTLEVTNGFCTDRITKALSVLFRQQQNSLQGPASKLELLTFVAYPNPSHSYLDVVIELNEFVPLTLDLIDLSGRLVYRESFEASKMQNRRLAIEHLDGGIYFLRMFGQSPKGQVDQTKKIVKTE